MPDIYIGLVHHPVYNKNKEIVTTSLTNLDIHDIARTSKTFALKKYFIINPQPSQKEIFMRIKKFWQTDIAQEYNIARFNAFDIIEYVNSITEAKEIIKEKSTAEPKTFATSARNFPNCTGYDRTKKIIAASNSCLILFGTAHGLTEEVMKNCDYIIEKIKGRQDYNHLSVRSAIAITLDRIISDYK